MSPNLKQPLVPFEETKEAAQKLYDVLAWRNETVKLVEVITAWKEI